jgi:uncharacterized membrane protein YozB (DUF420 family)
MRDHVSAILGTAAPVYSDLVVLFEVAAAVALLAGMFVVRSGRVRAHAYLQSTIVLVNVPVVLSWMVPQYLRYVAPTVGSQLGAWATLLPTLMLVLGVVVEATGIYIVLVAGTNWIPERWRFRNYKLWMRTTLGLWWVVLVLGLLTYYAWYVLPPS